MIDTIIDINATNFLFILYILGGTLIAHIIWSELYHTKPTNYKDFSYIELETKILKELGSDALYTIEHRRTQKGIQNVESLIPVIIEYIHTHQGKNFNELIKIFHFQEEIPLRYQLSLPQ